ncbi:hypothetical protein BV372_07865 [Nostoc sp. T09]|uniref:hypothetical protein n=1 Tax=Nostoc sp. T09 TaxID=1932621 RepID=UPI000A38EFAC|nr:hypothetical protein [Nostoc sp. T09]OUL36329.1 hypothetical protein BV372_07865 [Nostoc sp. T09]
MNLFKSLLVVLMILLNFAFAQPSFADKPKVSKNPDYVEVTKAIKALSKAKEAKTLNETVTPEEIQQKIDELTFQKYALETGINWGQCTNQTGKTIAVYGKDPSQEQDDDALYDNGLYFLADGQSTRNEWDCDGFYLPNDATIASSSSDGQAKESPGPVAVKIADGSHLVIKTNPDTAAIELNVPNAKVVKAKEVKWFIPNVSQAFIDTRVPNVPTSENS